MRQTEPSPAPFLDVNLPTLPAFRLMRVPGGQFRMGSSDDDPDALDREKPAHNVQLNEFYLAEFPVTQALWIAVMGENPSLFKGENRPVEQVSWFDAAVFCNRLSTLESRKHCYRTGNDQVYGWNEAERRWDLLNEGEVKFHFTANGYRLPTEAEWEYAARGGGGFLPLHAFVPSAGKEEVQAGAYAGSDLLDQVGWYTGNKSNETRDVGLLLPNELGIYDLSGNVFEWCGDWYGDYTVEGIINPAGPEQGSGRVIRGGSWSSDARYCRVSGRYDDPPGYRGSNLGFRLVLAPR